MNKSLLSFIALALVGTACLLYLASTSHQVSSLRMLQDYYEDPWDNLELKTNWEAYKMKFNKIYETLEREKKAFINWLTNLKSANSMAEKSTWVAGETQFTDMENDEFRRVYLNLKVPERTELRSQSEPIVRATAFASIDWRGLNGKSYVTSVKNQGGCGSCWAFATIGAMESLNLILGGGSLDLSEQQLVSCTKGLSSLYGCSGGWPGNAMNWIATNGVTPETNMPYVGNDAPNAKCPNTQRAGIATISGSASVSKGSVDLLKQAVSQQPVVVCIDASNWGNYKGGVFSTCSNSVNHAVLLVGYTSTYWIIKNSWGTGWGESGYIKLAMGNTCGIADYATYPKSTKALPIFNPDPNPNPEPEPEPELQDYDLRCKYWHQYCTTYSYVKENCLKTCST